MERKTQVHAEDGKQEIIITREFDLPLDLLFRAYVEADIIEQWMGTKVLKLDARKHGSYQYETIDPKGNRHGFSGVIHELVPGEQIVRTFEMDNTPFGVQLERYTFIALDENTSRLHMQVVYESVQQRDEVLKLPFAQGIHMAHNRMENILKQLP